MYRIIGLLLLIITMSFGTMYYSTPGGTGTTASCTSPATAGVADTIAALTLAAGDTVVFIAVASDTDTVHSSWNLTLEDGTGAAPVVFVGVKAGTSDEGAAIDSGDFAFLKSGKPVIYFSDGCRFGDYYDLFYLNMCGPSSGADLFVWPSAGGGLYWCVVTNTVGSFENFYTVTLPAGHIFKTDVIALNSSGVYLLNSNIIKSFVKLGYGQGTAVHLASSKNEAFETFTYGGAIGINIDSDVNTVINCGVDTAGLGISIASTEYNALIVNTSITRCTTNKMSSVEVYTTNKVIGIHSNSNTGTWVNVDSTRFIYRITGEPLRVDPANGNDSLQVASPLINSGVGRYNE